MFDFYSIAIKPRGPMMSSYTSRATDFPFPLKFLVTYDTNKFLRTSSKDVENDQPFS